MGRSMTWVGGMFYALILSHFSTENLLKQLSGPECTSSSTFFKINMHPHQTRIYVRM